jgi:hypothetical protein
MVDDDEDSITDEAFKAMVTNSTKRKVPISAEKYLGSLEQAVLQGVSVEARFAPSKEMVEAFRKKGKSESDIPVTDTLIRLELGTVDKIDQSFRNLLPVILKIISLRNKKFFTKANKKTEGASWNTSYSHVRIAVSRSKRSRT